MCCDGFALLLQQNAKGCLADWFVNSDDHGGVVVTPQASTANAKCDDVNSPGLISGQLLKST